MFTSKSFKWHDKTYKTAPAITETVELSSFDNQKLTLLTCDECAFIDAGVCPSGKNEDGVEVPFCIDGQYSLRFVEVKQ